MVGDPMIVLHRVNSRELDGRNDIMLQSKFTGGSLVVSKERLSLLYFFLPWFSFRVPQYAKKRTLYPSHAHRPIVAAPSSSLS